MKPIIFSAVFLLAFSTASAQKSNSKLQDPDCAKAVTQSELNECSCKQFHNADAEMNSVYRKLVSLHAKDELFISKLRNAQRAWLAFRDAQLEAIFPDKDPRIAYGSSYTMCYCANQRWLTEERTKQLKMMLNDEEGDLCSWSR